MKRCPRPSQGRHIKGRSRDLDDNLTPPDGPMRNPRCARSEHPNPRTCEP
jgi:hypothetical protein